MGEGSKIKARLFYMSVVVVLVGVILSSICQAVDSHKEYTHEMSLGEG